MTIKLSKEDIVKLKQLHRSCKHRKHADKPKAILLLDKGHSCVEVGEILLLDADTIRTYRNTYLNEGAESLLSDNNKGTTTFLTSNQLEDLEKHLTANVYTDSKGIVAWVENSFGIRYSCSGINALLNRLGFVYKKPILTPCKANVEKQEAFVKQYKELKEHLKEQDQIYFMDGVHPQHKTIAGYGWIKKGQKKEFTTNEELSDKLNKIEKRKIDSYNILLEELKESIIEYKNIKNYLKSLETADANDSEIIKTNPKEKRLEDEVIESIARQ